MTMRGTAASIRCPRCELEAPPADAIGKFTTCGRCKLVFDASARIDAPVAKRRVVDAEPEPHGIHVGRKHALAIAVAALAGLAIAAVVWLRPTAYPSEQRDEHTLDERAHRDALAARIRGISDRIRDSGAFDGPTCKKLVPMLVRMPTCRLIPETALQIQKLEQVAAYVIEVSISQPAQVDNACKLAVLGLEHDATFCR